MKKSKKNSEYLKIGRLAELSNTRASTIKYYTEIGILPFEQGGEKLARHYHKTSSLKRLKKIKKLQEEDRLTIEEIKKQFK